MDVCMSVFLHSSGTVLQVFFFFFCPPLFSCYVISLTFVSWSWFCWSFPCVLPWFCHCLLIVDRLTAGMFFSKIVGSYNAECREVAVVRNWHNVTKKNKTLYFLSKLSLFYHLILSVVPLLKESIGILMQRTPFSLDHALPECYQRVSSDHTQCSKKR